ncbi:hypothetical protein BDP81DRAFT_443707 [Colletotrichum phormii]|uniref:Uncharacterized protein n=1 Tax=Colletotrichum phormii TaxID=359342 RepID=A0AAJ0E892_9PEZI|nr:uncharacterized protein BDP81DRAFT_443707 [Colletotrichum phormii]KAK1613525.1 hypothetical protein BDP81DRAFT_443707 [Colletotrichum phormii]
MLSLENLICSALRTMPTLSPFGTNRSRPCQFRPSRDNEDQASLGAGTCALGDSRYPTEYTANHCALGKQDCRQRLLVRERSRGICRDPALSASLLPYCLLSTRNRESSSTSLTLVTRPVLVGVGRCGITGSLSSAACCEQANSVSTTVVRLFHSRTISLVGRKPRRY